MKTEIDFLIEEAEKEEKYFKDYLEYAKEIKKKAKDLLGKVKVFIFGSILKTDEIPEDIDILIISPKLQKSEKKSEIRTKLFQKLGFSSPFELHLITPKEYQSWYKNFIDKKIMV